MAGADVVVIGSGIAGASAAFGLARRGAAVTIVDDGRTGQATAASAGIVQPWSSAYEGRFYALYAAGAAFYPALLDRLAEVGVTRTDYRRTGSLVVHADPSVLAGLEPRLRARVAAAGAVAGGVERIDGAAARSLFPPLDEGLEALLVTGGGRVDGRTLRDALLDAAVRLGAVRVAGDAVLAPAATAPVVAVGGDRLAGDAVVAAAGAWTTALLAAVGCAVPVAPQKGQIAHLRLPGTDTSRWPTVYPVSHHYLVAFDDSRVVAGATRETGSGFDTRVTAAGQLQVLRDALSIAPGLARATVVETRVGLRPLAEELPVVGAVPDRPGLFVATGYGPAGLTTGPLLGDALARLVLGEPAPELEATAPAPSAGP